MGAYEELLKKQIANCVWQCISEINPEMLTHQVESEAVVILSEIQKIIMDEGDDFEKVEKIVCLMEEKGLSCGGCHDF